MTMKINHGVAFTVEELMGGYWLFTVEVSPPGKGLQRKDRYALGDLSEVGEFAVNIYESVLEKEKK